MKKLGADEALRFLNRRGAYAIPTTPGFTTKKGVLLIFRHERAFAAWEAVEAMGKIGELCYKRPGILVLSDFGKEVAKRYSKWGEK